MSIGVPVICLYAFVFRLCVEEASLVGYVWLIETYPALSSELKLAVIPKPSFKYPETVLSKVSKCFRVERRIKDSSLLEITNIDYAC